MKTANRALDEFRSLTQSFGESSEKEQIVSLKAELLEALERADEFERDLECLEDAANLGDTFDSLSLPRSLLQLQERILAAVPPGAPHEPSQRRALKELRLELLEIRRQCQALDAFCRLLLRRKKVNGPATASDRTHSQATP
ncbi:MAG: hypothetical protein ACRENE_15360 [Polyangiaceae bacterium]